MQTYILSEKSTNQLTIAAHIERLVNLAIEQYLDNKGVCPATLGIRSEDKLLINSVLAGLKDKGWKVTLKDMEAGCYVGFNNRGQYFKFENKNKDDG